jgi:hypothetical protein
MTAARWMAAAAGAGLAIVILRRATTALRRQWLLCDAADAVAKILADRRPSDLRVVIDFDLTMTAGGSSGCHDVLGLSTKGPAALRDAFATLMLPWSSLPKELQGDMWWQACNEALIAHGRGLRAMLPEMLRNEKNMAPRPGVLEFLRTLIDLNIPTIIVSAGFATVIESWLAQHGLSNAGDLLVVSSNRLVFNESGDVVAVEPSPPVTSKQKRTTVTRNASWFERHAARRTTLVIGDRLSDIGVTEGLDMSQNATVKIGFRNDEPPPDQPPLEKFLSTFECVMMPAARRRAHARSSRAAAPARSLHHDRLMPFARAAWSSAATRAA